MVNIPLWTRLTRFDLQNLSISLGNAALEELPNWPLNGEGRRVKALTENITRLLEATLDRRDPNYSFDILESAIKMFREIEGIAFYKNNLSHRVYVDRKGASSTFEEAFSTKLQTVTDFAKTNRPAKVKPKPVRTPTFPDRIVRAEAEEKQLADLVPAQKSAPLQFEINNGKLQTKRQSAKPDAQDRQNISRAKSALLNDANALLDSLRETNADPRLSVAVVEIRDVIASDADVIRLGTVSLTCGSLVTKFSDQLPDIVSAKFESFGASLSLFVGQFPEWQRFVDNANATKNLSEEDISSIYRVSKSLVENLKQDSDLVDPQVPRSIELLIEAVQDPKRASKRAVFGVVRTLENLIGTIFIGFGGLLGSTFGGVKEGAKASAKVLAIALLLGAAAQGASQVSPAVAKITQSNWMEQASKLIEKALEK